MKQVLIRRGEACVEEVPAPVVERGTVLVAVDHSCISSGTELSGLQESGMPLLERAIRQPEKLVKVARMVATQGVTRARSTVEGRLSAGAPTGYSAAGTIIEVGPGVDDLETGQRVACAGAQCAHHAQYIRVPRNLVVPVPEGLDFAAASTVTLGAIALQGVRRANPTLGETFVVIGLGLLGQLTAQMLRANGCRVIGADLNPERVALAERLGTDCGLRSGERDDVEHAIRLTGGVGADGVIITAATPSNDVVATAFRMCRRKGRVVLVGDVGLALDRADIYRKELDFLVSCSYGPGRYDKAYEEQGLEYPLPYVRWTENRNMEEYLRLLAEGRVRVTPLVAETSPIDRAPDAYRALESGGAAAPLVVLLRYPERHVGPPARVVANPRAIAAKGPGRVRLGLIGAGAFACDMHLPNIAALTAEYDLRAVASRTGHNASAVSTRFGAAYATSDWREVIGDGQVDAVLIATRHDLHAQMTCAALAAGKHVLVEKPLALNEAELASIEAACPPAGDGPLLLTGFNRRFSIYADRIRSLVAGRHGPMMLTCRMNAGHLPADHWVHGPEGGGRNIGEACHVYDLFTFLTGGRTASVSAHAISLGAGPARGHDRRDDNFTATVTFDDGSVATLLYTALGATSYPKERLEIFVDGTVIELDNYTSLRVHGAAMKPLRTRTQDKGQREELIAFARAIRAGGAWPIPLWQQTQAMRIAFEVQRQIDAQGHPA